MFYSKDSNRGSVLKKKRFDDEFGSGVEDETPAASGRKPDDYYKTFAGNTDDGFKVRNGLLEGHRFKTWCQQILFAVESPFKSTLPLVICTHNINSCMRCKG